jgi:hypothetical protein
VSLSDPPDPLALRDRRIEYSAAMDRLAHFDANYPEIADFFVFGQERKAFLRCRE